MLTIVNVTKDDSQKLDDYEIRINQRVIGRFQHKRAYNGAAQCLRDAADSIDKNGRDSDVDLLESFVDKVIKEQKDLKPLSGITSEDLVWKFKQGNEDESSNNDSKHDASNISA